MKKYRNGKIYMLRLVFYVTMLLLIIFKQIPAQQKDLQFQHITTADGLVTNWMIYCPIVQDAQGYLWIGSDHGLHKYDGYNFKVYINDKNDENSISNNSINNIFTDSKGRLWFATNSGLNRWIPEDESFERYYPNPDSTGETNSNFIKQIAEDNEGNLWLGGTGLKEFNPETKKINKFFTDPSNPNSISSDSVNTVFVDRRNIIWIGTSNGLDRYNEKTKNFTRYDITKSKFGKSASNNVFSIYEDLEGHLLLGSTDSKLYYFDRKNGVIESLQNLKNNSLHIWPPNLDIKQKGYFPGTVRIFQSPSTKEYWISVSGAGINRFDSSGNFIQHYGSGNKGEHGLPGTTFTNIYEDRGNTLWIGTFDDGIYKVTSSASNFLPGSYGMSKLEDLSNQYILSVKEDSKGNLWLGTADGILYKYNIKSKEIGKYGAATTNARGLSPGNIAFVFEDSKNNIWVGTLSGLSLYNPLSDSFTTFYIDSKESRFNHFVTASEDSSGNLIFGVWVHVENYEKYYKFIHNEKSGKVIFKYDSDYNPKTALKNNGGKLKEISQATLFKYLPKITEHAAIEDKNGMIWISTSEGLFKLNPLNNKYKLFTTNNGLPVNTMGAILEDDDGNLWIGNSTGLLKVNPDDDSFVRFGKDEGLTNNLFQEEKAAFKGKNGLLYFGGFNGLTVIDPKRFKENMTKPDVQITGMKIFGKSIPIEKNGVLKKSISVSDKIELDYNQNDLTIEYVGLHYKNSAKNRYAYKLEPYETNWNMAGEIRNVRYTNLSAGRYTFYVKAANSDGIWNEEGKKLSIIINPPPWAAWWAYSLYILFACGFLYSIRKFELNRKLKNVKIRESQLRAEAAELQAKAAEAQSRIIQGENERKSKELEEARQLQRSMLPKQLPQLPHLNIAVYMKTATEVGGDYYDFNVGIDGTLTVVLGDATGHGMRAGTMVTSAKSLFNSYAPNPDILFTFREMTRCIKQMQFNSLAMCMTMLKIQNNRLVMSAAGMPPVLLYKKERGKIEEYLMKGMPLGTMDNFPYELKESELLKGDTLLLMSDGLPELQNEQNEIYGYTRTSNSFEEVAGKEPEEIINYLKEQGSRWVNGNDPEDDITFVVIKVK